MVCASSTADAEGLLVGATVGGRGVEAVVTTWVGNTVAVGVGIVVGVGVTVELASGVGDGDVDWVGIVMDISSRCSLVVAVAVKGGLEVPGWPL